MSPTAVAFLSAAPLARLLDVCSLCGAAVEPDDDGPCCPDARIVAVALWRPLFAIGVTRAPALGTPDDIKRLREEMAAAVRP